MRCLTFAVAAALMLPIASTASAQGAGASPLTQRWLVLPTRDPAAEDEPRASVEALHSVSEALRQELSIRGELVWRADRDSERFEVLGSAPAPELSQGDIDRWVERSRAAVRYLARADYKAARRELKAAQRLADRAAEELNREAARAQQVLDTCLFMVRAYLETKNQAAARRQARECRQLVPRVEPTAFRHTPEVRELLDEVDARIAAEAPGVLSVTSSAPACLVRINGVEFAKTPLSGVELPVGTYRVQVECEEGQRGRIHRVAVRSGENALAFDAALERAVHSRPVLHLDYASAEASSERMNHARRVAEVLGGSRALVVRAPGAKVARFDLRAEGYAPASAWVSLRGGAPNRDDLGRALDALFEGRSVDFSGEHPMARASWRDEGEPLSPVAATTAAVVQSEGSTMSGAPRPRAQRIAGWSLFGAGVASIGASVGLHVWRGNLGESFESMPANLNAAQQWYDARIAVWGTAAFGGVATSAAMPLLLPEHRRTPWWGWTLGAAGLGLSAYAIYEGVTMTSCPEPFIGNEAAARACVARGQEAGRIALALAGAAPLLSVPLVYLFRPLRAEPSVSVSPAGAVVRVRKVF